MIYISRIFAIITFIICFFLLLFIFLITAKKISNEEIVLFFLKTNNPYTNNPKLLYRILKRFLDIVCSLFVLLFFLPLIIIIIIVLRLTFPYQVFTGYYYEGYRGKIIVIKKFCIADDTKTGYDPRVTKFGRLLMATSLDTLPMFYSVLKGDLSIVGLSYIPLGRDSETHKQLLTYIKPGIINLRTIARKTNLNLNNIELDRAYVVNCGIRNDLKMVYCALKNVARAIEKY